MQSDEEQPYEIELAPLLQRFTKQNLSPRISRLLYKVHIVKGRGSLRRGGWCTGIYRDAEYTMALSVIAAPKWLRWLPSIVLTPARSLLEQAAACISFGIYEKAILVKQIQGVEGMGNELKHIRWEKFLLKLVEDWARANGFEKISILKAEKNEWWPHNDVEKQQRFKMHYDVTAKRSGFKFCPEEECYVKQLIVAA